MNPVRILSPNLTCKTLKPEASWVKEEIFGSFRLLSLLAEHRLEAEIELDGDLKKT